MTDFTIRPAHLPDDYPRLTEIYNTFARQPITAEYMAELETIDQNEGGFRYRAVVEDASGHIIASGLVSHRSWETDGRFFLWVVVDPANRRQGVGTLLLRHIESIALEQKANHFDSSVRDDDPVSRRFAEAQGYTFDRHVFESRLDLTTFDPTPYQSVLDDVKASGIRIFSLADEGDTEDARRKLHAVNTQTSLDDPLSSGTFPDFDALQDIWKTASWFKPESQFLAADGDAYVGLSAVAYYADSNSAFNLMTGVLPNYRGRKIALALKVTALTWAKNYGAAYIRTNNGSTNAPMLAVNRKLGYIPEPGEHWMAKKHRA